MYFKYQCGNEVINVFRWTSNPFNKTVTVDSGKKSFTRSLHEDEKGEFFTWNKKKIYTNDWIHLTMAELRNNLNKNARLQADDLCVAIASDGPKNVRLEVPTGLLTYYDNNKTITCHVEEDWNREVLGNYKLRLVFTDEYGQKKYRDFYTSDLFSMIRSGDVIIKDSVCE